MLQEGLYEQVINKELETELAVTDKLCQTASIDSAEAAKVLAKYVAEIVEEGLEYVKNGDDLSPQVELVNRIIETIVSQSREAAFDGKSVVEKPKQLLALLNKKTAFSPSMKRHKSLVLRLLLL